MKEALKATSVLTNPTSPQISLSCGLSESKSAITSLMTLSWSGVSVNLKVSQNFLYSLGLSDTFETGRSLTVGLDYKREKNDIDDINNLKKIYKNFLEIYFAK